MNSLQKQQYFQQLGQNLLGNLLETSLQDFAKYVSIKLNISEQKMNGVLGDYLVHSLGEEVIEQKPPNLSSSSPLKKARLIAEENYNQERKKNEVVMQKMVPQAYAQKTVHEGTTSQTKYKDTLKKNEQQQTQPQVEEKKSNKFLEAQEKQEEEYVAKKPQIPCREMIREAIRVLEDYSTFPSLKKYIEVNYCTDNDTFKRALKKGRKEGYFVFVPKTTKNLAHYEFNDAKYLF